MNCTLTSGRNELSCFNNVGGVKALYFMKFVEYGLIDLQGLKTNELTNFPPTVVYKYELNGANFSEQITNDENGISFAQNLGFDLFKQDLASTTNLDSLTNFDLRVLVEFNNATYKMIGAENGCKINSLTLNSGTSKNSLNGYNIGITATELYAAPLVRISNFIIIGVDTGYLFEDGINYLFEDNNNFIFN